MNAFVGPVPPGLLSPFRLVSAATTNATLVGAGVRRLYSATLVNTAAYAVYLKLYDSGVVPTAGAGTIFLTLGLAAGASQSFNWLNPLQFTSGLSFVMTKLPADSDTTALAAGDLIASLFYS